MHATGYVQISTVEEAQTCFSLDAREQRIRAFCQAMDWTLLSVIRDEGCSAKDLNRPGILTFRNGSCP